jgi:vacuolar-type H+-ATPase subunit H
MERVVRDARERAGAEQDEILRSRLGDADREAAVIVAQAEAEARRIRETGEERLAGFVADVVARVREAGS